MLVINVMGLADGVHLTRDAHKDAAKSILGLHNRKSTPATATQTLLELRGYLAYKGIVNDTPQTDAEKVCNYYWLLHNQRQFLKSFDFLEIVINLF